MSQKNNQITYQEAKAQINTLGISMFMYIIVLIAIRYGLIFINLIVDTSQYPVMIVSFAAMGLYILSYFLVSFIPFKASAIILELDTKDYNKKRKISITKLLAFICIGIGIELIATSVISIFGLKSLSIPILNTALMDYRTYDRIAYNILYIIFILIIKPYIDEYVFRGIIQRQLGHYSRSFGVVASALLYALAQPTINEAVPCFFLGFYLSLISIKYHSIKPTIAIVRGIVLFYLVSIFIPKDFFFVIIALVIIVYIVSALSLFNNVLRIPFITIKAFNAQLWTMFLSSSSIIICIIIQIVNFIIYELLRI
ncbi:MAG: CPBP family glutamic-type intramembrane protease [Firmicutes bacterium]|nr:CPBP family glutamic-type intramembrane protease [Erysipelotrichaceae bacterium]MDD6524667.1 CPBP family glutamic-type intramembrane protease [Bacillota bacterium]MDY4972961.1 CPBP family glutamic-type intramembrane protease [Erysipelotrichaceae bacterium]